METKPLNNVVIVGGGTAGWLTALYAKKAMPKSNIYLYLTPDLSNYTHLKYYIIKRIQDVGAYTNTPDVPYRFLPCMVSGLAYYLSMKINPKLTEQLRLYYEDELQRALVEDGQRTSVFISPQAYYGNLI